MIIEGFFNLDRNPFIIHPDVDFYCQLTPHEEAINMIMYAISNQDSLIKVTGNIGLGKSIVAGCIREKLLDDEGFKVCEIRNPNLTTLELVSSICQQLARPTTDEADKQQDQSSDRLLSCLENLLVSYREGNKKIVLIIDEAQAMEDRLLESLRLLTNLEYESKPLLQIILFGQDELDIKLNQHKFRQLKQRICFAYKVRALTADEVSRYVQHRLYIAGSNYREIFSRSALSVLAKYTEGIPRNINIIAHKAMLLAAGNNTYQVNRSDVLKALSQHGISRYGLSNWKLWSIACVLILNIALIVIYLAKHFGNI